ncbi:MAG TPA: TlyA family RNA methyltransferase [Ktedonobacterales bacterium]|nr:TlyA family RNA methyltransferase [Ktedonobacterales bacterium]
MGPEKPAHTPRHKVARQRLDLLLTQRGLAPSRERARALIMAGEALVDGRAVTKAGELVAETADITLASPPAELRYVSRGGLKLERALDSFALSPADRVCLDVGASTGGFTDLLLRRGARRVYAVDVGHGQLAWSLRTDPRVVVMERVNIRHMEPLPEPVECVVIDVSFISLRLVLPRVASLLASDGWVVALVKPQFEAGRAEADRGKGVISDPEAHRRVLRDLLRWIANWPAPEVPALTPLGLNVSPIAGRDGNHEYLLWLAPSSAQAEQAPDMRQALTGAAAAQAIERVVAEALGDAKSATE